MLLRELTARLPRTRLAQLVFEWLDELELSAVFWLTALAFMSSLLLGGGTRGGFLSDAILELICIPPLLLSASRLSELVWRDRLSRGQMKFALAFCAVIVLVPLIQLVPLPYSLWSLLPNREPEIAVYQALGRTPGWLPISVSPNATALSALALIPPLAIFTGTLLLDYRERRLLSLLLVAFGVASSFLGLLQLSQGPSSHLRFFTFTNTTEAVGFFANRNHFAALLYTTLLFAAVWAVDIGFASGFWRDRRRLEASSIGALTASFLTIVVLLAAEAMTRSRAGMVLTMVGLGGACALMFADRKRKFSPTHASFALAAVGIVLVLIVQFGLFRILQTFSTDPLEDARFQFLRYTMAAASSYLPFGSGMGTFVPVYAMFERSPNIFVQYINHAHDDFAELTLESGVIGPALVFVFAGWFALRSRRIWTLATAGAGEFDRLLMRAATLVIVLLAAHCFVDYPLRTAAMTGVLAFACGLMFVPPDVGGPTGDRARRDDEMVERVEQGAPVLPPAATSLVPASSDVPLPAPQSRGRAVRWGENIDWPEAWRKSNPESSSRAVKPPAAGKPDTDISDAE
jgi:O-Antigen ligase